MVREIKSKSFVDIQTRNINAYNQQLFGGFENDWIPREGKRMKPIRTAVWDTQHFLDDCG